MNELDGNFYQLVLLATRDGIWDWPDMTQDEEYWSDQWYRLLGYEPGEIAPKASTFFEILHPDDREPTSQAVQDYINNGMQFDVEYRLKNKAGEYKWFRAKAVISKNPDTGIQRMTGSLTDIHEEKKLQSDIEKQQRSLMHLNDFLELIIESSEDFIFVKDAEYKIIKCNQAFLSIYPEEDRDKVIGSTTVERFNKEDADYFLRHDREAFEKGSSETVENVVMPNGQKKVIFTKKKRFKNSDGKDYILGISRDITEMKEAERNLENMALYDSLTGIPNRSNFLTALKAAISRSKRSENKFAVLFIDLDNFKQVNDSLGHHIGDLLLKEVTSRLRDILRDGDFFARISGDEFAIIVENIVNIEEINQVANRCLDIFTHEVQIKEHQLMQSMSIGISIYPDSAETPDKLLQYADTAMYRAKEKGKNNFVFFRSELDERIQRKNKIEIALRRQSSVNDFELFYQPQLELKDEKIVGVEALIRWYDDDLGQLPPDEFIPISENNNSINVLGAWVIDKAFSDYASLCKLFCNPNLILAVNISTSQLNSAELLDYVKTKVAEYNILPKNIVFEVTESKLMRDVSSVLQVIAGLSKMGIQFAIDDFGKGYSSMNYLKVLPVKYLKIDKSFLVDIDDESNKTIVKAMLALAFQLNMIPIAEGVEERSHLEFLLENGCTEAQGYYFSKPMSLPDLQQNFQAA